LVHVGKGKRKRKKKRKKKGCILHNEVGVKKGERNRAKNENEGRIAERDDTVWIMLSPF
jgi:hypothetical protein